MFNRFLSLGKLIIARITAALGFLLDVCTAHILRGWIFQIFIIPPPQKTFYISPECLCANGEEDERLSYCFPPFQTFHIFFSSFLSNLLAICKLDAIETLFYVVLTY